MLKADRHLQPRLLCPTFASSSKYLWIFIMAGALFGQVLQAQGRSDVIEDLVTGYLKDEGQLTIEGRTIIYKASVRGFSFPVVYDAVAQDFASGIRATAENFDDPQDAYHKAVANLLAILRQRGLMNGGAPVTAKPDSVSETPETKLPPEPALPIADLKPSPSPEPEPIKPDDPLESNSETQPEPKEKDSEPGQDQKNSSPQSGSSENSEQEPTSGTPEQKPDSEVSQIPDSDGISDSEKRNVEPGTEDKTKPSGNSDQSSDQTLNQEPEETELLNHKNQEKSSLLGESGWTICMTVIIAVGVFVISRYLLEYFQLAPAIVSSVVGALGISAAVRILVKRPSSKAGPIGQHSAGPLPSTKGPTTPGPSTNRSSERASAESTPTGLGDSSASSYQRHAGRAAEDALLFIALLAVARAVQGTLSKAASAVGYVVQKAKRAATSILRGLKWIPNLLRGVQTVSFIMEVVPDYQGSYKAHTMQKARPTADMLSLRYNYQMWSHCKGIAFILNNIMFYQGERHGSQIDLDNMVHLFQELGYMIILRENLEGEEIEHSIGQFAAMFNEEGAQYDSAVVVLMTHGDTGVILGTDLVQVRVQDLQRELEGCRGLIGKPKMFFVQACRGRSPSRLPDVVADGPDSSPRERPFEWRYGEFLEVEPDNHFARDMSDMADVHIAFATTEGHLSLRSEVIGSFFIQALCEVFFANAHKDNLDTLMNKVTDRVNRMKGKLFDHESGRWIIVNQTPECVKRMRKALYFLPGYSKN